MQSGGLSNHHDYHDYHHHNHNDHSIHILNGLNGLNGSGGSCSRGCTHAWGEREREMETGRNMKKYYIIRLDSD